MLGIPMNVVSPDFASVSVANANISFDSAGGSPKLLWRGHVMYVSYNGLVRGLALRH